MIDRSVLSKAHAFKDFRKSTCWAGQDLTYQCFVSADLRNADLTGCHGRFADFRSADLRGAVLTDVAAHQWDFTGADLRGAVLINTQFLGHSSLRATLFRDALFQNVTLDVNGYWSAGADLPRDLPFDELKMCGDNNPVISRLLHHHGFTDIARFVFGKDFFGEGAPCWQGSYQWVMENRSQEVDDLEQLLQEYSEWGLWDAWEVAKKA